MHTYALYAIIKKEEVTNKPILPRRDFTNSFNSNNSIPQAREKARTMI